MTSDPTSSPPTTAPGGIEPSSGKPLSGCTKLLVGCGVVLVLLGVVVGGLAFLGYLRLIAPPEPVEPNHVVTAETQGWLRLASLRADPGIEGLLMEILAEHQRLQREEMERLLESEDVQVPSWVRPWLGGRPSTLRAKDLDWWMPRAGTLSLTPDPDCIPDEGCSPAVVGALEVGAGARFLGFFLEALGKMDKGEVVHLGDQAVLPLGEEASAVFRHGSLLFASRSRDLGALVDRLTRAEEQPARRSPGGDPVAVEIAEWGRGDWDVFGHLDNRQGLFDDAFVAVLESVEATSDEEPYDPAALARSLRELRFRLNVVTAEESRLELTLETESADQARRWRRLLERWRREIVQASEALSIAGGIQGAGSRVDVTWRLQGVSTAIRHEMRRQAEALRAKRESEPTADHSGEEPDP